MCDLRPPQQNLDAFSCLYMIEVALRELIIECLETQDGPTWYRRRLPSDILQKYQEARNYERSTPWTESIPHHPIYYVDFPDLRKVIERADNWRDAFEPIFTPKGKSILATTLYKLEPIRNLIAHNRTATTQHLQLVRAALAELSAAIGPQQFGRLASRSTQYRDIPARLDDLRREADTCLPLVTDCQPLPPLAVWPSVSNQWWFDGSYLGCDLDPIVAFFRDLQDYSALPRLRGTGHIIENWVNNNDISEKHAAATRVLSSLVSPHGRL